MGQTMTKSEIETLVREVTDEEVAFYHEYGWVMMPRLVAPDFAAQLLRVGQEFADRNAQEVGPGKPVAGLARNQETEPFRSFMFSERMAQNATRLVNRKRFKGVDVPLRYRVDLLLNKPPGAAGSVYHQDSSEHGSDRVGELQFWLALAEVTPEMGAMRFVSRSHREGPLGSVFNDDRGDLLKQFPNLTSVWNSRRPSTTSRETAPCITATPSTGARTTPPTSRAGPTSSRIALPTPATGTAAPATGAVSGSA